MLLRFLLYLHDESVLGSVDAIFLLSEQIVRLLTRCLALFCVLLFLAGLLLGNTSQENILLARLPAHHDGLVHVYLAPAESASAHHHSLVHVGPREDVVAVAQARCALDVALLFLGRLQDSRVSEALERREVGRLVDALHAQVHACEAVLAANHHIVVIAVEVVDVRVGVTVEGLLDDGRVLVYDRLLLGKLFGFLADEIRFGGLSLDLVV